MNLKSSAFSIKSIKIHMPSKSATKLPIDTAQARPDPRAKAPAAASDRLPIGELVRRSGVAASALRFYEDAGLMQSTRSGSGRRQYARADLRRLAFVRAAQAVGLSLEQIRAALAQLPDGRTPTVADWEHLSASWRPMLDQRIAELTRLRDTLSSCIGCGCLSLSKCGLYNPDDQAARHGAGARYLLGDSAPAAIQQKPMRRRRAG
ncbi:redox-sensitive transcriptional activator SoxR [Paucibacter sp. DJ1R-11]|uniref:redox-sensitive transcriptional activator SoxR n=2 Tax=unclassified Roseateles TaxID=2626991 RepID=UPI0029623E27|nr:redox-sensitive transcriptional activator SoxR [Paucibacter sp. DJ1R-11]